MGEVSGELAGRGGAGRYPAVRLPPRRSSFVGRTAELGEIAARLRRHTVVTLTGVGGVGKTALAVEAAWIEASAGRAVMACYIDLVPCRTDEQVVAALVEGVGIRGAAATAGLDAVAEAMSGGRSLLVLDNCEHVLESARRACDHLAGRAADLRVLVTSRIPLDIEPESVWRVQPMAVPGEADRPVVTEAVTLFFARAAMAGVALQGGPVELALAGSICRQAGGLPLVLGLVAGRLRVASLAELAERLRASGWPARASGSGRHDSLDACLAWSHALLSPANPGCSPPSGRCSSRRAAGCCLHAKRNRQRNHHRLLNGRRRPCGPAHLRHRPACRPVVRPGGRPDRSRAHRHHLRQQRPRAFRGAARALSGRRHGRRYRGPDRIPRPRALRHHRLLARRLHRPGTRRDPRQPGPAACAPGRRQRRRTRWHAPAPPSTSPAPSTRPRPASTWPTCCCRCIP